MDTRRLLGVAEDCLGNFESAYRLFSDLIAEVRSNGDRHDRASLIRDRFSIIDWTTQRGRIAVRWSMELRRANNPANQELLPKLLTDTTAALKECEMSVFDLASQPGNLLAEVELVYNYYWISTEAYLAKGELERRTGQHQAERQAFHAAKRSFDLLDAFAREHNRNHPKVFDDLKARVWAGMRSTSEGGAAYNWHADPCERPTCHDQYNRSALICATRLWPVADVLLEHPPRDPWVRVFSGLLLPHHRSIALRSCVLH